MKTGTVTMEIPAEVPQKLEIDLKRKSGIDLRRDREGLNLDWREGREELGGVKIGKAVIRIDCMKIYFQ